MLCFTKCSYCSISLFLFSTLSFSGDYIDSISDAKLVELANLQVDESWYGSYKTDLITEHNKHWDSLRKTCLHEMKAAKVQEFFLIVVLNENGRLIDSRTSVPNYAAKCFEENLAKIEYPSPPNGLFIFPISIVGG